MKLSIGTLIKYKDALPACHHTLFIGPTDPIGGSRTYPTFLPGLSKTVSRWTAASINIVY